jgi:hypothetical protein
MKCEKHNVNVTGCSRQLSLFDPKICEQCSTIERGDKDGRCGTQRYDNGRGIDEANGAETVRASLLEGRKRYALRSVKQDEASLP